MTSSAPNGPCPASPDEAGARMLDADYTESVQSWYMLDATPANYCVSVWSKNGRGALTGPTTNTFAYAPPPASDFG